MKGILRHFLIESISLYIASQLATGMIFDKGNESLLLAALALAIASFVVKPVVNLLLLPINLLTFNLFRFLSSAVTLYLVDLVLPEFHIASFHFLGLNSPYLFLPQLELTGAVSYLAFSIVISFIAGIFYWLVK